MLRDVSLEIKRDIYTKYIRQLREDKITENAKKRAVYGYADEDDYNFLAPYGYTSAGTILLIAMSS